MSKFTIMHKNINVADIEIDDASGTISKISDIASIEHAPVGTVSKGTIARAELNDWWKGRSIPASRQGIQEALETLDIKDTQILTVKSLGLSLSDQYWIKPQNSNLSWSEVNFFENDFSEDIGNILFGAVSYKPIDFAAPDNTSDGWLKKRWKIINGERCLFKGGSNPFQQEPFNEVIASKLMERLNIPHIPYEIHWQDGYPFSVCKDFVTSDTELVSAYRVMQIRKRPNHENTYQHFVNCCTSIGISDIQDFLDKMITADYILANEDRHFNNFGLIRNAETLEWIGTAPIFDTGTSLFWNKKIGRFKDLQAKPFKTDFNEQLKLVSSFEWLDFSALNDFDKVITKILVPLCEQEFISQSRAELLADFVMNRIENIRLIAEKRYDKTKNIDNSLIK